MPERISTPEKQNERPGSIATKHLEHALMGWEDEALMAAAHTTFSIRAGSFDPSMRGGVLEARTQVRRLILEHGSPNASLPDVHRFQTTLAQRRGEQEAIAKLRISQGRTITPQETMGPLSLVDNVFVPQLLAWTRSSRRIFSLDNETAHTFLDTPEDFSWDEIVMPFDSFAIELRQSPVQVDTKKIGSYAVSSILVTRLNTVDPDYPPNLVQCRFFLTPASENALRFNPLMTKRLRGLAEKIDANTANREEVAEYIRFTETHIAPTEVVMRSHGRAFQFSLDETVADSALQPITNVIRKMVAGTCLYLSSAPGESPSEKDIRGETWHPLKEKGAEKKKPPKGISPHNIITDEAQIFDIRHIHEFRPGGNYIRYTDKTGRMVEAHPRRAHKRRPPLSGPAAKQTVEVKATWVHRDQIPRDALPAGAVTVIK